MPEDSAFMWWCSMAVAIALMAGAPARAESPPKAFEACAACHSLRPGEHQTGPSLHGVMGRRAGSAEGFRFSGPMRRSGLLWDADTLRRFLVEPQALVPGNRMPFSGMESPAELDAVLRYLQAAGS